MRRIKLIVVGGFVMAAMLALTAGPAMANEFDFENDFDDGVLFVDEFGDDEEVIFVEEDEGLYDALCSPGVEIDLAGCIFSDAEDEDFLNEDEVSFVSLDDDAHFDDGDEVDFRFDDDDDDHDNHDNERSVTRIRS